MSYDQWKTTEPESCDPGRDRDHAREDAPVCDMCGVPPIYIVSIAGLGLFCGRRCADIASLKHEAAMRSRMKETA